MTFLNHIYKFKSKLAISNGKEKYTYSSIEKKSKSYCKKINKRSLVFLIFDNDINSVLFYLGLLKNKCVIFPLNQNIKIENLNELIKNYQPNFIITSRKDLNIKNFENFAIIKSSKVLKNNLSIKHKLNKDLCLLMSTSGTTGSPKLVKLIYSNYLDNTKKIIKSLSLKNTDKVITTLPLSYTYGLSILNSHLFVGSTIHLNKNPITKKDFWDIYKKFKPTIFYGVPFIYEMLKRFTFKDFFNNNLRLFANAGGSISNKLLKEIIKISLNYNIPFYQMYGQTEASPRMSLLEPKFNLSKFNSIGKPLVGGKFQIIDSKEKIINKPFKIGELVYHGKNVCMGYCNNFKDLSLGNINKFKLFTGDLAYFDNNNFFFIKGRKKNFIKIFGNRIDLEHLEKFFLNKGFKIKILNQNNIIVICYNKKDIDKEIIFKIMNENFNINKNYVTFKFVKNIKYNQNKNL